MMVFFSAREAAHGDAKTALVDAKTALAATFLKVAALASTFLTLVLAAIILSWQARAWILTGEWSPFPISRVIALAGFDDPPVIRAATGIQVIFDWALDLPASGFLLAVAAILTGFSVFAASVEEQSGKRTSS
jgi:hypothetical protein